MEITQNDLHLYSTCQFDTCTVCNSDRRAICCTITNENLTFNAAAQVLKHLGWQTQNSNGVFYKNNKAHKIYLFVRDKALGIKSFTVGVTFEYIFKTRKELLKMLSSLKFNC